MYKIVINYNIVYIYYKLYNIFVEYDEQINIKYLNI